MREEVSPPIVTDVLTLRDGGELHTGGTGENTRGLLLVPGAVVSSIEIQLAWRTTRQFYDN